MEPEDIGQVVLVEPDTHKAITQEELRSGTQLR